MKLHYLHGTTVYKRLFPTLFPCTSFQIKMHRRNPQNHPNHTTTKPNPTNPTTSHPHPQQKPPVLRPPKIYSRRGRQLKAPIQGYLGEHRPKIAARRSGARERLSNPHTGRAAGTASTYLSAAGARAPIAPDLTIRLPPPLAPSFLPSFPAALSAVYGNYVPGAWRDYLRARPGKNAACVTEPPPPPAPHRAIKREGERD